MTSEPFIISPLTVIKFFTASEMHVTLNALFVTILESRLDKNCGAPGKKDSELWRVTINFLYFAHMAAVISALGRCA